MKTMFAKKALVKDWMSKDVITIPPDAPLPEAYKLMMTEQIRRLPVVDYGDEEEEILANGRLLGIVTLGDVRGAQPSTMTSLGIWEMNYLLTRLTVSKFMTPDPVTISPQATLGEAARLMLENRTGGLPVINESNHLVGIITESDIFRVIMRDYT